jgi:hypothetical protein
VGLAELVCFIYNSVNNHTSYLLILVCLLLTNLLTYVLYLTFRQRHKTMQHHQLDLFQCL